MEKNTMALTGDATLSINDRVILDFAEGDVSTLTYPNELATLTSGKNGNALFARNASGRNADLVLRIIKGSSDDKFLQGLLSSQERDLVSFSLLSAEYVLQVGDGFGGVTRDVSTLIAGIFTKNVDKKENVGGETEQSVSVYTMKFAKATRSLM